MFIDSARVTVKAGDGGRGAATFRREKYVPLGGPDGGDGGRGGCVILRASQHENTLFKFRHVKRFAADNGRAGQKRNQFGRQGDNLIVNVPCGTSVFNAHTDELICDLTAHDDEKIIAKGGRGGRGNCRFKTHKRNAPSFAELGEPGEEIELRLELKLLADVGLVGFPNAGKSTFLSVVSNARPKIADYPFTTLSPILGTVALDLVNTMVISDLPGLIEGAAEGHGLGHRFLRHVERTGVILHLIDINSVDKGDPFKDYSAIRKELDEYSPVLASKKEVIAFTKIDAYTGTEEEYEELCSVIRKAFDKMEVHFISSLADKGIKDLLWLLFNNVKEFREQERALLEEQGDESEVKRYVAEAPFVIEQVEDYFVVSGENITRIVQMTDLDNPEAVSRLDKILNKMGIIKKLRALGAEEGDHVVIDKFEFIWKDNVEYTPPGRRRKKKK
jgi:GTP-binding protein